MIHAGLKLKQHQLNFIQLINLQSLIPHLNEQDLITRDEQDRLTNPLLTECERIVDLLYIIERQGAEAYPHFLEAIKQETTHSGHKVLYDILVPKSGKQAR